MKYEEVKIGKKEPSILPIVIASVIFPITVGLWILNYFTGLISTKDSDYEEFLTAPPSKWMLAIGISLFFAIHGSRKKSLSKSGCLSAMVVGFFVTLASYCFMMALLAFFLSSSRATKFRQHLKKKFEENFQEGGQRNWIQVLCNGGMATELAILYLLDVGYGQLPVDFRKDWRASWLGLGILGALACANGDTWASELGTVVKIGTSTEPRLVLTGAKVPKGTNGGVSLGGLIFSLLGGGFIGLIYYISILLFVDSAQLGNSPAQYNLIVLGGIGGLLGSLIDSILGATLQFSGIDKAGRIHERPGPGIKKICGNCVLDNHSINLVSTIFTGLILPYIGLRFNF